MYCQNLKENVPIKAAEKFTTQTVKATLLSVTVGSTVRSVGL